MLTNTIVGISHTVEEGFLLQFAGTSGVQYFVETTTNLMPPVVWEAMPGSTVLVTEATGAWAHSFTNAADRSFFRSSVVDP